MLRLLQCPVHELTGLYCMTCGATRAMLSLLHGQVATALQQNALVVLLLPLAAYQLIAVLVNRAARRTVLATIKTSRRTGWFLLIIALAFMVIRNLPIPLARYLIP